MALINDQKAADQLKHVIAKELEGKLFATVEVSKCFGTKKYLVSKDHYTVLGGIVYSVDNGFKQETADIFDIKAECIEIGIYDPKKNYVREVKDFSYKKFVKTLGL